MSSTTETVRTRILIMSDTHSAPFLEEDDTTPDRPFKQPLFAADVLIHCGDLTMIGSVPEYHDTLDVLAKINAPLKLVIAGNHDLTLDEQWMRVPNHSQSSFGSWREARPVFEKATKLWKDPEGRARREGVVFLDEGVHEFKLRNGARLKVYASPYTPEFYNWAFAYEHDQDRFNPSDASFKDAVNIVESPVPSFEDKDAADVLITHGPPYAHLDEVGQGRYVGCPHLLRALTRARPLVHCFGHIHEGWGAERVRWSDDAKHVAKVEMKTDEFIKGEGFKKVCDRVEKVKVGDQDIERQRHVHYDGRKLEKGRESLLVNAAIMDVAYTPRNAPWLVEVELAKA